MTQTSEKYIRIFGAKPAEHKTLRFVDPHNRKIVIMWQKNEYRAFREGNECLIDLHLGSSLPENLKAYIMSRKGGE